jgi:hypothetical protein
LEQCLIIGNMGGKQSSVVNLILNNYDNGKLSLPVGVLLHLLQFVIVTVRINHKSLA